MSTSSQTAKNVVASALNFYRFELAEAELHPIRKALYHSSGEGYYIFKNFISPELVSHIRSVWPKDGMPPGYALLPPGSDYYIGCPNYYVKYPDGSLIFYNFFHATPLDEVTHEVSGAVHMLRSRLSGRGAFEGLTGPRGISYRVTLNRNFDTWIEPHTDFMDWERRWEKGAFDPSRLQATLFLSERGVDYTGNGFLFETNRGERVTLGGDVPIGPGDLLIWRFGNLHSVENVVCRDDQLGFMRILYPIYDLAEKGPPPEPAKKLTSRIANAGGLVSAGRAVLGRIKRRIL